MKKILSVLLLFAAIFAAELNFPHLTGRVVDEANILSNSAKENLTKILANHESNTTNQVVVVTLNSLQGRSLEEYSLELGRYWAIGQKDKDNGVLLVVAPNEKEIRIEVGYGLEGSLTDAISHEIIQRVIIPKFKDGNFEQGILDGVAKIIDFIDEDSGNDYVGDPIEDMFYTLLSGVVGGSFVLVFLSGLFKHRIVSDIATSMLISGALGFFIGVLAILFTGSAMTAIVVAMIVTITVFVFVFNSIRKMPIGLLKSGGFGASSSSGGFSGGSSGGFSGGGGSFGGGGASGRW
ncbi:YgcG family protein [Campylobacter sp. CCUG 57310]|uniref:TPM domain-containing protein n=1 Tax=Campylobacter sp. CCUG 57310 TaxID=2517362 RepID=UPI0015661938|nr:TPM domain-containing protein [Campylobacter sp. CCUG 57310]QKF92260.1 putative phosphatase (TPM domain) [Campylobacter sp. CCUG 57310]